MIVKSKIVLITGASSGIGRGCAEVFAEAGANSILLARRKNLLDELADYLIKEYNIKCISIECDIRNYEKLNSKIESLPDEWKNIDILINNAGLARGMDKIHEADISDWEEMIDTNIKGLLYTTRIIAPGMVERHEGHIINIGSVAGWQAYPGGNVYCGTKHAVKALSEGMIIDLNGTGVRVTNLDPGLVKTEFSYVRFHGDSERAKKIYESYTPLTGRDIAEAALFAVTRPAHVTVQDMMVTPTDQANAYIINKNKD